MKNSFKIFIVLATALVATSLGFAQTIVNPDDEGGSPAASAAVTTSAPVAGTSVPVQVADPVDFGPQITELQAKITELENRKRDAQKIPNVTVRRQTIRVIQDISSATKQELADLNDHVRRVLQPELARVRGYASEGVRLARKHETDIAALDARIKTLESAVTGGTASTVPPTTKTAVPPETGTTGAKVNQNWFENALQGAGQFLTILGFIVVAVVVLGGLFALIQGMLASKSAAAAADRRDAREDARIARTVNAAQWAADFPDKPSGATGGKVRFTKQNNPDGSHLGKSSGEFEF